MPRLKHPYLDDTDFQTTQELIPRMDAITDDLDDLAEDYPQLPGMKDLLDKAEAFEAALTVWAKKLDDERRT